jgi:hypothetical protein
MNLSTDTIKASAIAVAPKTAALKAAGLAILLALASLALSTATAAAQPLGEPEYVDPCQNTACLDPAPQVSAPRLVQVGDPLKPLPGAGGGSPGHIAIRLQWSATDDRAVSHFHLEKNSWGLGWSPVSGVSSFTGFTANERVGFAELSLQAPGIPHQFRVKAVDTDGNTSAWAYSGMIGAYDDSSPKFQYAGDPGFGDPATPGWSNVPDQFSLGGSVKVATHPASRVSFSCSCRYIAWVGRVHPKGGEASVYVDGAYVPPNVSQGHASISYVRRVLFVAPFEQVGRHTIEIFKGQGVEIDVDAFVVDHG